MIMHQKKWGGLLCIAGILSTPVLQAVVSTFTIRPQSFYTERKVSGETPGSGLTFFPDMDSNNGYLGITVAYERSFRPNTIAHSLFGNTFSSLQTAGTKNESCENTCAIRIQGSLVPNRDANAWLADNFYLPADYNGAITVSPQISNTIVDFNWYMGLDQYQPGLYFRLYGPYVHTKWNLRLQEITPINNGTEVPAGLFTPQALVTGNNNLLTSPLAYFAGNGPVSPLQQANVAPFQNANQFTTTRNALNYGKMANNYSTSSTTTPDKDDSCSSGRSKNGFGELRAELGWNVWQYDDWHVGFGVQAAAPTGSKVEAHYLFDPIVGNGRHWELGGLVTAHWIFWRSMYEDKQLGVYVDANLTHLFSATEHRTFDLIGKPLSKYMLAAKQGTNVTNNLSYGLLPNPTASLYQFTGEFTPVANLTAREVNVSFGVQADIAAWLNYKRDGFSFDLGYNYFGRSSESISCNDDCLPLLATEQSSWTLKGDAYVYGYQRGTPPTNIYTQPLTFSESDAVLQRGTCTTATPAVQANGGLDNPQPASGSANDLSTSALYVVPGTTTNQTQISAAPVFLSASDINYKEKPRLSSNAIFAHLNYKWERECWQPYFGVGGEAEFGQSEGKNCNTNVSTACNNQCQSSQNIALSQWGVWVKLGVAFD